MDGATPLERYLEPIYPSVIHRDHSAATPAIGRAAGEFFF